jgi:hypothetical protein
MTKSGSESERYLYWYSVTSLAAVACLLPIAGFALDVGSNVSVGVLFTDNVRLESQSNTSDTILEVIPSLRVTHDTGRLDADLNYRLEGYYYERTRESQLTHWLSSRNQYALDIDHFFLDFGASYVQALLDPSFGVPVQSPYLSRNLIDRAEFYVGPSFRYRVRDFANVSANYRRNWVKYENPDTGVPVSIYQTDQINETGSFSIGNTARGRGYSWALLASANRTEYADLDVPWEYRQVSVELGRWMRESTRLFALAGKESDWNSPGDPSLQDFFWEVGFTSSSSAERFSVTLAFGDRTYGASKRAAVSGTFDKVQTTLSYNETPTTEGRQFNQGFSDVNDDYLTYPGRTERYISKRLQWRTGVDLGRTNVDVYFFDETRTDRYRIDGTRLGDENQEGVSLSASYDLGSRTQAAIDLYRAYRDYELSGERTFSSYSIRVTRNLGSRTQASLVYQSRTEESADDASYGYRANLIALRLTRTLSGARENRGR